MTRSCPSHCLYSLGTSCLSQYIICIGSGLGAAGAWGILRERVPKLGGACGVQIHQKSFVYSSIKVQRKRFCRDENCCTIRGVSTTQRQRPALGTGRLQWPEADWTTLRLNPLPKTTQRRPSSSTLTLAKNGSKFFATRAYWYRYTCQRNPIWQICLPRSLPFPSSSVSGK